MNKSSLSSPIFTAAPRRGLESRFNWFGRCIMLAAVAAVPFGQCAWAANTEDDVKAAAADLGINSTVTYNAVAGTTSDVTFAAATTYAGSLLLNNAALSIGTLNDLNATAISISGNKLLTLNTASNIVAPAGSNGGNASDLLFVIAGGSLSINDSAGITFANSGNVDSIGTLSLGASPVTITALKTITFTGNGSTTVGGNIAATTGALTVNGGTGSVTLSGNNAYTGATTLTAGTLNLTGTETASAIAVNGGTFNESSTGVISGGVTFTQSNGTSTLSGANTYTGATTITSGTLDLGGSTASGSISSSSPLSLGGGTLNYTTTGGATQTFASTALTAGGSVLNVAAGNTLNLNAITRSAGGTVNFGTNGAITTTTPNANGILGGYATIGGANFAVSGSGSATTALTTYDATFSGATTDTVATHNDNETGGTTLSAASTINSLTIADAGNNTLALNGKNLTFTSGGGLLYAGNGSGGGSYTISGAGVIGAGSANEFIASVNSGATLMISSTVINSTASAGSLTKGGAGTLILTANNVYTGPTVVGAGTLQIGNATATTLGGGTYAGAVTNNGALVFNSTSNQTFSGTISGPGSLTKAAASTLTLSVANTYTGTTSVTGGTLSISAESSLGTAPATFVANQLTLNGGTLFIATSGGTWSANRGITLGVNGGTISFTNNNVQNTNITGIISGPGALTLSPNGTGTRGMTVSGANTFAGGVNIVQNEVDAGNSSAFGSGVVQLGTTNSGNSTIINLGGGLNIGNSITITPGGTRSLGLNSSGGNSTLSGAISLTGGTVNPTLNLSQLNINSTFSITGGVTGTGNISVGGGSIGTRTNSNITLSGAPINNIGTITNAGGVSTGTYTISSVIGSNVTALISNPGTNNIPLVLSADNSGSNFYGDTTLTNGTINLRNANALANSVIKTNATAGALTFGSGATNITAAQIGGLSGTGSATAGSFGDVVLVNAGSGAGALALSIGNSNAANGSVSNPNMLNPTYSGVISGAGSITKVGSNTQTFTGANTYAGTTTIGTSAAGVGTPASATANGGILGAGGNNALGGTSSITVNNGGTLLLSGVTTAGTTAPGGISDRVNNAAPISLGSAGGTGVGGTIALGGTSPVLEGTAFSKNSSGTTASPYATSATSSVTGLGALTLSSNSTLDFGGLKGTMVFTSFNPASTFTLNIIGYTNTTTDGTTISGVDGTDDRLVFGGTFLSSYLNDITFNGVAGAAAISLDNGFYEITPSAVPEPTTVFGALALVGLVGYRERRRVSGLVSTLLGA